jgi:hypothetical protein
MLTFSWLSACSRHVRGAIALLKTVGLIAQQIRRFCSFIHTSPNSEKTYGPDDTEFVSHQTYGNSGSVVSNGGFAECVTNNGYLRHSHFPTTATYRAASKLRRSLSKADTRKSTLSFLSLIRVGSRVYSSNATEET